MRKICYLLLLGMFAACTNSSTTSENNAEEQTQEKEQQQIILADREPEGSHFKVTIAGREKIFDKTAENAVKPNHYIKNQSYLRLERFTADEKERISIQVFNFNPSKIQLPLTLPNDSLALKLKCSYYDKGDRPKPKETLKLSNDSKITFTEIKGDSVIGTIEGYFITKGIVNRDILKLENGTFRFKVEGLNEPTL